MEAPFNKPLCFRLICKIFTKVALHATRHQPEAFRTTILLNIIQHHSVPAICSWCHRSVEVCLYTHREATPLSIIYCRHPVLSVQHSLSKFKLAFKGGHDYTCLIINIHYYIFNYSKGALTRCAHTPLLKNCFTLFIKGVLTNLVHRI